MVLLRTFFIVVLLVGFLYAITFIRVMPPAAPIVITPVVLPVPPILVATDSFDAAGTIEYSKNNIGEEVPYVVYRRANGGIATKAIVFGNESECATTQGVYPCGLITDALRVYFGAGPVHITGKVVEEHVVVDRMSLA